MSETEKTMLILGLGGGIAMLIGAFILFLQNQSITGFQFHADWSGTGSNSVSAGALSWHGLLFLGLICIGMGVTSLIKDKEEAWED